MRVLFIDEEVPYPINTGKRARTFNLLTRLSKKNDITYLSYVDKGGLRSGDSILREHAINFIPVKRTVISKDSPFFYFRLLYNLFSKYPYIVSGHYSSRMQRQLNELLGKNKYDLLHCEISPYGIFMQNYAEIPKVIVAHNIESEIWQRYYDEEINFIKKRYIGLQLKRLIDYESKVLKKFDACISVSNRDAKYLNRNWQIPEPAVVDNGVDTDYFRPVREPYARNNIVFTGSMDWRPNQNAVQYFVKDILPKIRAEIPDVTFTIVGRKPPAHIRDLEKAHDGIEVTGTVNDVRPYVAKGQVFVVPLKIGGGSRLKILEALAMGKIVISTFIGAEGLEIEDGKHIILADDPNDFAVRTVKLLKGSHQTDQLGLNGRKLVETRYSWDSIAETQNNIWHKVIRKLQIH